MNSVFVEAHISDLHFGATDPKLQYEILAEQFIDRIKTMDVLDIVSINGDIFDHKFMANSLAVSYANMFISQLVMLAKERGFTILIISGTYEHDADQLKLFYPYQMWDVDIRIIEQVRFEYVKGKRILCIPELYGKGKEYYEDFLFHSGVYDSCYLHGTIAGSIYGKDIPDLNSPREPIFSINHFVNCKGPIISGHVHKSSVFETYFYYCGSPYRWRFGEEEEKGFLILLHNISNGEHYVHFEPIKSFRYDTVNLDDMLESDPQSIIAYIDNLKANGIDYLRVIFTKDNEAVLSVIRNHFRSNKFIRIDTSKSMKVKQDLEEVQEKYDQFQFLKDQSDPETKLVQYINQKEGYTFITADQLKEFISSL